MKCYTCLPYRQSGRGPGWILITERDAQGFRVWQKCPDCINGEASCCDGAGCAQLNPLDDVLTRQDRLMEP